MGRPSLNVRRTIVRLKPDTMDRIKAIVGGRGMSQFIREAVENELKRRAKSKPAKR